MTDNDIEQLIASEATLRRGADQRHLESLTDELNADLGPWCARRRRIMAIVAIGLLVALPITYSLLLPDSHGPQVVCNMAGGDEAVMTCAKQILTIT